MWKSFGRQDRRCAQYRDALEDLRPGIDAPTAFAERLLRDQYLFPFEAAITETPVMAVMPSYNEMDGVPSHKNRWLLGRVLRQEWGFDGMVVSDY